MPGAPSVKLASVTNSVYMLHVVHETRSLRSVPCQKPNLVICGLEIIQLLKAWIIRFDHRDNRIQARAFLERCSDFQSSNSEEASTFEIDIDPWHVFYVVARPVYRSDSCATNDHALSP